MLPTKDDARDDVREPGVELDGGSAGVAAPEETGELLREPGPCLAYASAKKRMDSSKA